MMQASLRTSALDTLRVDANILRLRKENRVFRVDLEFASKNAILIPSTGKL